MTATERSYAANVLTG